MFQNPNLVTLIVFCISFLFFAYLRVKKDGFDIEFMLDSILLSTLGSVFVGWVCTRWLYSLSLFHPEVVFLKPSIPVTVSFVGLVVFVAVLIFGAVRKHWSIYRVLDLVVLSVLPATGVTALIATLVYADWRLLLWAAGVWVIYYLIVYSKDRFIPAGYSAALFFMLAGMVLYGFFPNIFNLFYVSIIVSGGLVLFFLKYRDLQL